MKKNAKAVWMIAVAAAVAIMLLIAIWQAADGQMDIIAHRSVSSFEAMLAALPRPAERATGGWSLEAPDGTAHFIWGGPTGGLGVALAVDARPFLAAGLDASKLPEGYALENDWLILSDTFEGGAPVGDEQQRPPDAYKALVEGARPAIGYHMALDHYGILLAGGNAFEWAADLTKLAGGGDQDKDIVFVLNPEPLIAAGLDPDKVEGWVHAQVKAHDNGRTVEVYKLLKPFNLK